MTIGNVQGFSNNGRIILFDYINTVLLQKIRIYIR